MLFKLSNLNSNLALTLGYLNPALNNSALFDSHVNGILGHQTLLKSFQKRSPDYMWTDENGVFPDSYDAVIYHILLTLRMLCKGYQRICCWVEGRKRFEYATCGLVFPENRKKKCFQLTSGYVWMGPKVMLIFKITCLIQ